MMVDIVQVFFIFGYNQNSYSTQREVCRKLSRITIGKNIT